VIHGVFTCRTRRKKNEGKGDRTVSFRKERIDPLEKELHRDQAKENLTGEKYVLSKKRTSPEVFFWGIPRGNKTNSTLLKKLSA